MINFQFQCCFQTGGKYTCINYNTHSSSAASRQGGKYIGINKKKHSSSAASRQGGKYICIN